MIIEKLKTITSDDLSIDTIDDQEFSFVMDLLDKHHKNNCKEYFNVAKSLFLNSETMHIADKPFLHASSFKKRDLISVELQEIVKTMYSSGTSGNTSTIMLDSITAQNQRRVLSKIFESYMKLKRPVMLAIEKEENINKKTMFNARKAAIIGFGQMCKKVVGILDSENKIDIEKVRETLARYEKQDVLIFGFTGTVWEKLKEVEWPEDIQLQFSKRCSVLHGGGWKNLESIKVSKEYFNKNIKELTRVKMIKNYYGMIEQTGSIFMECEHGFMHENRFTRIINRNPYTLDLCKNNEVGIAQVLSLLPYSYPGMSILTDDKVKVVSQSCLCGRKGNAFKIIGRLEHAEIRGCSDAYKR